MPLVVVHRHEVPALDRLVDFLESKDQDDVDELTARLKAAREKTEKNLAATTNQPSS